MDRVSTLDPDSRAVCAQPNPFEVIRIEPVSVARASGFDGAQQPERERDEHAPEPMRLQALPARDVPPEATVR